MAELLAAGEAYAELKNVCIWAKDNAGLGSLYRSQHEMVFVFKHGRDAHRNNVQLGRYGRNRTNVWRYPCANSFWKSGDEGNLLAQHPTVKPVATGRRRDYGRLGARRHRVDDSFLGSGTTVIAARSAPGGAATASAGSAVRRTDHSALAGVHRRDAHHAVSDRTFVELEAEVEKDHV